MRMPRKPPDAGEQQFKILSSPDPEKFKHIQEEGIKAEREGKYRHWDILRHLTPPSGLTLLEWWAGIKMQRVLGYKEIPLRDRSGFPLFSYNLTNAVMEQLHHIDLGAGKAIKVPDVPNVPDAVINPHTRDPYIVHSLIEEAITSSQIEGAATTRRVAKEMLRSGRSPRDKSEQMIVNNYRTMQQIKKWKNLPLTKELILEMHLMMTEKTLDHGAAGRLRTEEELIVIEDVSTGEILHQPPHAGELDQRLEAMCDFANGKTRSNLCTP